MKKSYSFIILIFIFISTMRLSAAPITQSYLTDLSRFLAGKHVSRGSKLYRLTFRKEYRSFKRRMAAYKNKYSRITTRAVKRWRRKWMKNHNADFCFYPFAGADFINVYNFYPNVKTYLMIGLEHAGRVPDLPMMSRSRFKRGLNMMIRGFRMIVNYNFYRTYGMRKYIEKSPFTGTVSHILAQMGWLGIRPVAVHKVEINSSSKLVFTKINNHLFHKRIAIDFITPKGERKRVIYLRLDLKNSSLRNKPRWKKYLSKLGTVSGFLKAASYLLPRLHYSIIRRICLSNINHLIQGDSGIPFKYFGKNWNTTLFGRYRRAHMIFPSYSQPMLRRAYRNRRYRRLGFMYSYDRPRGIRNMMLAVRK
ncbi:MAG: hypothetical protein KAS64_09735 [Spirochaetes bacterium]|nr:hypothetical protein [Spirochaetota bacterium]